MTLMQNSRHAVSNRVQIILYRATTRDDSTVAKHLQKTKTARLVFVFFTFKKRVPFLSKIQISSQYKRGTKRINTSLKLTSFQTFSIGGHSIAPKTTSTNAASASP